MREIKFRAWDEKRKCFEYWGIGDIDGDGAGCKFPSLNQTKLPQMQYTGLKDNNGVEIYEGDIVKYKVFTINGYEDVISIIEFRDYGFKYVEQSKVYYSIHKINECIVEVIGNIYKNKELLEG